MTLQVADVPPHTRDNSDEHSVDLHWPSPEAGIDPLATVTEISGVLTGRVKRLHM
jgi:hypothetical protein